MAKTSSACELAIVGSGPAGYTAAIYAARAELAPLVVAGAAFGGQLMITTDVENYPGFPEGVAGPELVELFRKQAERFGTRVVFEDATRDRLLGAPVQARDRRRCASRPTRVVVATGAQAKWLGHPVRGEVHEPRRVGLRDLRRRALPRQGDGGRRRRRHRDGRGALPHPLRQRGQRDPPPRGAAREQDHGRPREAQREDQVRLALRGRRGAGRRQGRHRRARARSAHAARSRSSRSARCSSRSATSPTPTCFGACST